MACAVFLAASLVCAMFYQGPQHGTLVLAFGLMVVAVILASLLRQRATRPVSTDLWVAAFWLWLLLAATFSPLPQIAFTTLLALSPAFGAYAVARVFAADTRAMSAIAAAVGIAGTVTGGIVLYRHLQFGAFIGGPFLYQHMMAATAVAASMLVAAAIEARWRHNRVMAHLVLIAAAFIAFMLVGLSLSRGALLAGVAGIVVALAVGPRAGRGPVISYALGAGIGMLVASVITGGRVASRVATLANPLHEGASRFELWSSVLPLIAERPWFGHGPGALFAVWPPHRLPHDSSAGYFAHNAVLDYAVMAGIPAALLLAAVFGALAIGVLRSWGTAPRWRRWTTGIVAGAGVHALVDFNLWMPTILLVFGLALGATATTQPVWPHFSRYPVAVAVFGMALLVAYAGSSFVGHRHLQRASAALAAGDYASAHRSADRASRWWPMSDAGPLLKVKAALGVLERPAGQDPGDLAALWSVAWSDAQMMLRRNQYRPTLYIAAARVQTIGEHMGITPNGTAVAERLLRAGIARDPRNLELRYHLASALVARDAEQEALEVMLDATIYHYHKSCGQRGWSLPNCQDRERFLERTRALAEHLGDEDAAAAIPDN